MMRNSSLLDQDNVVGLHIWTHLVYNCVDFSNRWLQIPKVDASVHCFFLICVFVQQNRG
jgi:hypothetical protein